MSRNVPTPPKTVPSGTSPASSVNPPSRIQANQSHHQRLRQRNKPNRENQAGHF